MKLRKNYLSFLSFQGGYYRIYNHVYRDARISTNANVAFGTYTGPIYKDQDWKLVPRFEANITENVIWSHDNRQGSQNILEKVRVTTGLKSTSSNPVLTPVGFKQSLKAAASFAATTAEVQKIILTQIDASLSDADENNPQMQNWIKESEILFTAPKGKNVRVKQLVCGFKSSMANDDWQLSCNYKVEETDGDRFPPSKMGKYFSRLQ